MNHDFTEIQALMGHPNEAATLSHQVSAARLTALLRGSTYASLLVEYGTTVVPLRDLAQPYLGCSVDRACVMAQKGELALPAFRMGGQRSPWLVHLFDLAKFVDAQRTSAGSVNVTEGDGA